MKIGTVVDDNCRRAARRPLLLGSRRPESYWEVVGVHGPFALVTGIMFLLAAFFPLERLPLKACTFLALTGLPCPFCGFTRSFWAMAAGEWGFAFSNCPLAVFLYGGVLVLFAVNAAALLIGVRLERGRWLILGPTGKRWLWAAAGLLLTANWIYRMGMGLD